MPKQGSMYNAYYSVLVLTYMWFSMKTDFTPLQVINRILFMGDLDNKMCYHYYEFTISNGYDAIVFSYKSLLSEN